MDFHAEQTIIWMLTSELAKKSLDFRPYSSKWFNGSWKLYLCTEKTHFQYDILLEIDIVPILTDGPSFMLKVGKFVDTEKQLYFAHGIYLALTNK